MPNRIIKESLCESGKIAELTDFEFRVWIGLILMADDAGRGDARPAIIKARVFPLRDRVTVKDIDAALHGLTAKGCVSLYEVDGKPYFWFSTWSKHQRVRDAKPRYPAPDAAEQSVSDASPQVAASRRKSPQVAATGGLNAIQYNTNTNTNTKSNISTEQTSCSTLHVVNLPLNDGQFFPVTEAQVAEWRQLYPAVDVEQELRNMAGWLIANPKKRKTKRGILKFITGWLSRNQDNPRGKHDGGNKEGWDFRDFLPNG